MVLPLRSATSSSRRESVNSRGRIRMLSHVFVQPRFAREFGLAFHTVKVVLFLVDGQVRLEARVPAELSMALGTYQVVDVGFMSGCVQNQVFLEVVRYRTDFALKLFVVLVSLEML